MANVIGELELPSLNSISDLADNDDDGFVHCLDDGDHANDDFWQCSILMAFSVSLVIYLFFLLSPARDLYWLSCMSAVKAQEVCVPQALWPKSSHIFSFSPFPSYCFFHPGTIIYQNKHCETALNPGIPDMSWSVRVW